jgi:hypothetical protein
MNISVVICTYNNKARLNQTLAVLATQFVVHPTEIPEWKPHVRVRFVDVFGTMKSMSHAPDLKVLLAKIGQPTAADTGACLLRRSAHQGGWLSLELQKRLGRRIIVLLQHIRRNL